MSSKLKFSDRLFRAFIASVIATIIGAELIGLFLAASLPTDGTIGNRVILFLTMVMAAPLAAGPWVIPIGTVAAVLLSPLALRLAPMRTRAGLFTLVILGAILGFLLLYLLGFGISSYYETESPGADALMMSQVYGPVFGGLTAAGWWWQLPKVAQPRLLPEQGART